MEKTRGQTKPEAEADEVFRSFMGRSQGVKIDAPLLGFGSVELDQLYVDLPSKTDESRLSTEDTVRDDWLPCEPLFADDDPLLTSPPLSPPRSIPRLDRARAVLDDARKRGDDDAGLNRKQPDVEEPREEEEQPKEAMEPPAEERGTTPPDVQHRHRILDDDDDDDDDREFCSVGCQVDEGLLPGTDKERRKRTMRALLARQTQISDALRVALDEDDDSDSDRGAVHFDFEEACAKAKKRFLRTSDVMCPPPPDFYKVTLKEDDTAKRDPRLAPYMERLDTLAANLERDVAQSEMVLEHIENQVKEDKSAVVAQNYRVLLNAAQRARGSTTHRSSSSQQQKVPSPLTASLERRTQNDLQSAWAAYNDIEDYIDGESPSKDKTNQKPCHRSRLPWRDPKGSALW